MIDWGVFISLFEIYVSWMKREELLSLVETRQKQEKNNNKNT